MVEELCTIVHRTKASEIGKKLCVKLLDTIPRQLFEIAIQATIGSKIIARETLKPYRKDVTAKLVSKCISVHLTKVAFQCKCCFINVCLLLFSVRW